MGRRLWAPARFVPRRAFRISPLGRVLPASSASPESRSRTPQKRRYNWAVESALLSVGKAAEAAAANAGDGG
jgi:hypothetical protein